MTLLSTEEKVARRRAQVRKAVRKWRVVHKDEYNKYCREYLRRPEAHARHIARCKRYRDRKKSLRVENEMHDVAVKAVKVNEQSC